LRLAGEENRGSYDALKVFRDGVPLFLKEMVTIIGRHWLNNQLQEFRQRHGDILTRLSLIEAFADLGD
jgi:hypothetical protein